jgi:hypothetical protein
MVCSFLDVLKDYPVAAPLRAAPRNSTIILVIRQYKTRYVLAYSATLSHINFNHERKSTYERYLSAGEAAPGASRACRST